MEWEKASDKILRELTAKCQENLWLKRGSIMFGDDPFAEFDYNYSFIAVYCLDNH